MLLFPRLRLQAHPAGGCRVAAQPIRLRLGGARRCWRQMGLWACPKIPAVATLFHQAPIRRRESGGCHRPYLCRNSPWRASQVGDLLPLHLTPAIHRPGRRPVSRTTLEALACGPFTHLTHGLMEIAQASSKAAPRCTPSPRFRASHRFILGLGREGMQ